jgi:hypothetical protein
LTWTHWRNPSGAWRVSTVTPIFHADRTARQSRTRVLNTAVLELTLQRRYHIRFFSSKLPAPFHYPNRRQQVQSCQLLVSLPFVVKLINLSPCSGLDGGDLSTMSIFQKTPWLAASLSMFTIMRTATYAHGHNFLTISLMHEGTGAA